MVKKPRPLIEYWPGYGRLPFYYSVSISGLIPHSALVQVDSDKMVRSALTSGPHA